MDALLQEIAKFKRLNTHNQDIARGPENLQAPDVVVIKSLLEHAK